MSTPVTFLSFIQGIVAELKTLLAPFGVKDVDTHYGMFDPVAVNRFGALAPAARVAVTGVSNVNPFQGGLEAELRIAIYLFTRDGYNTAVNPPVKLTRDQAMLGLVQAVIQGANENAWSQDTGNQPTAIAAENLYGDDQAGGGFLLWAVSFTQGVNCDITDITQLANFAILTDTINDPDDADVETIGDTGPLPQ